MAHARNVTLKPLGEARLRYEQVDQDGLAADADALTLRLRAGVEAKAGRWSALVEGQGTLAVADDYFDGLRSEEPTSELQSLMRISYAVFCLKKRKLPP